MNGTVRMRGTVRMAAMGTLAALALAGCSGAIEQGIEDGVERLVEEGIEGTSGAEIDLGLDGDGAELPSSWPGSVPEPPGTVVAAFSQDDSGSVTFEAASVEEIESYVSALESSGFERETEASLGLEVVQLTDGTTSVTVGWVAEADTVMGTVTYLPATTGE